MAYNFVQANGSRIIVSNPLVTSVPITLSAWIRRDAVSTGSRTIFVLNASNDEVLVRLTSSNTLQAYMFFANGGAFAIATNGNIIAASAWTHVAARYSLSGSSLTISVYVNGVRGTDGSSAVTFSQGAFTGMQIASYGGTNVFGGDIADAGAWNTALSDTEIVSLSQGISCRNVNPQSLRFYAPLIRNPNDIRNNRTLTLVNSPTVSSHPRIYT